MISTELAALCCLGAGGHGRVVASQWQARRGGNVVFADHDLPIGTHVAGLEVRYADPEAVLDRPLIVTVGDNQARSSLQRRASQAGVRIEHFIADPAAYFADMPGAGTVVLAGAVVNQGARLGEGVIVNSAIVEHDCAVGDFSHLSPGACMAGGSEVGSHVWVGANATVLPLVVIAPGCVIGAGSVVTRSIAEPGVYVGAPARRIR